MRRFTSLTVLAALVLAGCAASPATPEGTPATGPAPGIIARSVTATVRLDPERQALATESPITTGTFADPAHGWMVADFTRLLATTDGGAHWQQIATFTDHVRTLSFVSASRGWITTEKGQFTTADGGRTWKSTAPPGAEFRGERLGWALEQNDGTSPSFLSLSADGGKTWSRVSTPCKPGFTANTASFVTSRTGYLLCSYFQGSGGTSKWLYRTDDGGAQWQLITGTIYAQPLPDFPPGIQVGARERWPDGALPPASGSPSLEFLDEQHGLFTLIQGPTGGWTFTTADGGHNWHRLPVPQGTSTRQSRFFTPTEGRVLVNNGRDWAWLETHDGGTTWSQLYPPLTPLLADNPTLQFQDANHGVALGTLTDPTAALTTTDRGQTWQLATSRVAFTHSTATTPPLPPGKHPVDFVQQPGAVWAILVDDAPALDPVLLTSTDGGSTWTQIDTPGISPTTVTAVDALHAWLTDRPGHLYRTVDGGRSWEQLR